LVSVRGRGGGGGLGKIFARKKKRYSFIKEEINFAIVYKKKYLMEV